MNQQNLKELFHKYQTGAATDEEIALLESWYLTHNNRNDPEYSVYDRINDANAIWADLQSSTPKSNTRPLWKYMVAAASLIIIVGISYYLLPKHGKPLTVARNKTPETPAGTNKVILTLANGEKIILTEAKNGVIASQGKTLIKKTDKGQVVYSVNTSANMEQVAYNTMSTPKGGQYWVILPDGSKVLLNAMSSLRYPTVFEGNERKVELTGEAYFEVTHNPAMPFRVVDNKQTVEVLGTHFNINSYADESLITTTLLEGSVKVYTDNQQLTLKPGEQSQFNVAGRNADIKLIRNANITEAIAWKNGVFDFKNASIKHVMINAERWYDINVSYQAGVPDIKISGRISRDINFSGFVDILKFEGVKFKISGKNVTILN